VSRLEGVSEPELPEAELDRPLLVGADDPERDRQPVERVHVGGRGVVDADGVKRRTGGLAECFVTDRCRQHAVVVEQDGVVSGHTTP
jgi:hypothetical protein